MVAAPVTPYAFISYASADRARALAVADALEGAGIAVWLDRRSIAGGTSWSAEIVRGIRGCAALVLLVSPVAMASPNVAQEAQLGWESRRPLLPLLLASAAPPEALAYALAGRQWIEVLDRPDDAWLPEALRALAVLGMPATAAAAPTLRVCLLGTFSVVVGMRVAGEHGWRLRKAASLIKLLALAPGQRLHREQVLEHLWPDLPPGAAANNLKQALHAARRALEPGRATAQPPAYLQLLGETLVLAAPADGGPPWIDVAAFEAAAASAWRTADLAPYRAAVDLYTGDLLPEDRYEGWAADRREGLRGRYHALLLELARLHEGREEFLPAIEALGRLVASEPTHEDAHTGLMRLYALTDRRQQALSQYRALVAILARDLDAVPAAATEALHATIRAGRLVPAPPIPAAPPHQPADRAVRADADRPQARRSSPAEPGGVHNLPAQLTRFIGRERELADVAGLLAGARGTEVPERPRLLTLAGVGGVGKTRLALEVAARLVDRYRDGVWLVELGAVTDPALVPRVVAIALGVREEPARAPEATLAEALRARELLLVVDNCEHLPAACAALAEALLRASPRLQILATSREPLHIGGEVVWRVPPLGLPDLRQWPLPVAALTDSDASRLFAERARAVQPGFVLTERNALVVARVCQRLDGLPLAIELAAARVAILSVEQLAVRLDNRFRLLTGGGRTAPTRQQTLRAAVAWSYELLSPAERTMFARLAVFAGGWTLDAAEAVTGGAGIAADDILELLAQVVDKSLAQTEPTSDGMMRYHLLETLREYGAEQLAARGETAALRRRHAAFFLALVREAAPRLQGPGQAVWLDRLAAEHANLWAALRWAVEAGEAEHGLLLGGALWPFWYTRGYLADSRRLLAELLALPEAAAGTPGRARALYAAGTLAWTQGDHAAARALYEESRAIARHLDDRQATGDALFGLGVAAAGLEDYRAARACHEQSLAIRRELGDRGDISLSLHNFGRAMHDQGDHAAARPLYEGALALRREAGDQRGIAASLWCLGDLAHDEGEIAAARRCYRESLAIAGPLGDRWLVSMLLGGFAGLVAAVGDQSAAARALRLAGASARLREAIGLALFPAWQARLDRRLTGAWQVLAPAVAAAAWADGQALSLEEAIGEVWERDAATSPAAVPGC